MKKTKNIFNLGFTLAVIFLSLLNVSIAEARIEDASLALRLSKGEGAFILRNPNYKPNKVFKGTENPQAESLGEFLSKYMEPKKFSLHGKMYYLSPISKNKEKSTMLSRGYFLVLGPPGEYTVTKIVYETGRQTISTTLLGKINIEAGKLKYVDDYIAMEFISGIIHADYKFDVEFKPDEAHQEIQKLLPLSSKYFTAEQMQFTVSK